MRPGSLALGSGQLPVIRTPLMTFSVVSTVAPASNTVQQTRVRSGDVVDPIVNPWSGLWCIEEAATHRTKLLVLEVQMINCGLTAARGQLVCQDRIFCHPIGVQANAKSREGLQLCSGPHLPDREPSDCLSVSALRLLA